MRTGLKSGLFSLFLLMLHPAFASLPSHLGELPAILPPHRPALARVQRIVVIVVAHRKADAVRHTVIHGTVDATNGIAGKTTRERIVTDAVLNPVLTETWVYTGTGYEQISWTAQQFNEKGQATLLVKSDGATVGQTWGCCGLTSRTENDGIENSYTHATRLQKRAVDSVSTHQHAPKRTQ